MRTTSAKRHVLGRSVLAGCTLAMMSAAAQAACTDMSTTQSRPLVTSFLNRPVGLLERYPFGGRDLSDRLGLILGADLKGTLPGALEIIRSSNHAQKEAIGTALGSANAACLRYGDSRAAELVQNAVSRMTDNVVRSQFYAISASQTDPAGEDPLKDPTGAGNGRARLPVGRLPSPFAPQIQLDPNRPLPPIR